MMDIHPGLLLSGLINFREKFLFYLYAITQSTLAVSVMAIEFTTCLGPAGVKEYFSLQPSD